MRMKVTHSDLEIGMRIRARRIILGLTQQQFAEQIGVTYQQAHKYERGLNRVSASLLKRIAEVLQVSVNDLLYGDDVPDVYGTEHGAIALMRGYIKLSDEKRALVRDFVAALA